MVRPGIVPDAVVDRRVRVTCPLGAELPDGPFPFVLGVEEADEAVERVAVRALGEGVAGAGGCDDWVGVLVTLFNSWTRRDSMAIRRVARFGRQEWGIVVSERERVRKERCRGDDILLSVT